MAYKTSVVLPVSLSNLKCHHSCAYHALATWIFPLDAELEISPALVGEQAISPLPALRPPQHIAFCNYLSTGSLGRGMPPSLGWKLHDMQGLFFSLLYTCRTSHDAQHVTATQYLLNDVMTTSHSVHTLYYTLSFSNCPALCEDSVTGKTKQLLPSLDKWKGMRRPEEMTLQGKTLASCTHLFFLFAFSTYFINLLIREGDVLEGRKEYLGIY